MTREPWWDKAACGGVVGFTELAPREQREWCEFCPVRVACLDDALRAETLDPSLPDRGWPVRGGLLGEQRRKLIPARPNARTAPVNFARPIKHGTNSGYRAHLARGEAACGPCLDGHRTYQIGYRARLEQAGAVS